MVQILTLLLCDASVCTTLGIVHQGWKGLSLSSLGATCVQNSLRQGINLKVFHSLFTSYLCFKASYMQLSICLLTVLFCILSLSDRCKPSSSSVFLGLHLHQPWRKPKEKKAIYFFPNSLVTPDDRTFYCPNSKWKFLEICRFWVHI